VKARSSVAASVALLVSLWAFAATAAKPERVIHITAKRFEFAPATIELKLGEPVILEITTLDRKHGMKSPELGLDAVIMPGKPTRVRLVPDKAGTFSFHCSVFCGSGHEDMAGQIVVTP
jgi:cytochrome c oxidase subunit II